MKVIPETRRAHSIRYLRFCHWLDTSTGGMLIRYGTICQLLNGSALTYFLNVFIFEIFISEIELNNLISIKTKVNCPHACATLADFRYRV
jgi:hypothetical protein